MNVNREEFAAQIARLKPALAKEGGVIPALSHIGFDGKYAYAYDGGLGIQLALPSDLDGGLPGHILRNLLGTSPLEEVDLDQGKNGAVVIKMGRSKTTLHALDSEVMEKAWPFPAASPKKGAVQLTFSPEFIEGLAKALIIKASPETRIEHHGIILTPGKEGTELYTTDSKTILRVGVEELPKLQDPVLLPREFVRQIVDQCTKGAKVTITPDHLRAEGEGILICSNRLDQAGMSDLQKIVGEHLKAHPKPVLLPPGLEAACNRAMVLADADEPKVMWIVEGNELNLKGTYAFGQLDERLELDDNHPPVKLTINVGFIKPALINAETFSATKEALALHAEGGWLFLAASAV